MAAANHRVDVPISPSATSSSSGTSDGFVEDLCCICLEPFASGNPSTATGCKHEYHLQCILEWSQRSAECPTCWQILTLIDPLSQELISSIRTTADWEFPTGYDHGASTCTDYPQSNDGIVQQQLAVGRDLHQPNCGGSWVVVDDCSPATLESREYETPGSTCYSPRITGSNSFNSRQGPKGSVKSIFSAVSIRCKDSFSKGSRGLKEMLSKGVVQREMSAGIAGVVRIMERLDPLSNRAPPHSANFSNKGKGVQEDPPLHFLGRADRIMTI